MGGRGSTGTRSNADKSVTFNGRSYTESKYYILIDGKMYRHLPAGDFQENRRPYRKAGNYDIYIDSFPRASLPYSKYYIADKAAKVVYETEITQGTSNEKEYLKQLVEELKRR